MLQFVVDIAEIALGSQCFHFLQLNLRDILGQPGRMAAGVFSEIISKHCVIEINYMAVVLYVGVVLFQSLETLLHSYGRSILSESLQTSQ